MNKFYKKADQILLASVVFFILLLMSGSFYYFWDKGTLDPDKMLDFYNASNRIEEISTMTDWQSISAIVTEDTVKKAVEQFKNFDKKFQSLKVFWADTEMAENLKSAMQTTAKDLNALEVLPAVNEMLSVFSRKMATFKDFVENNKWKTLQRVSARSLERLNIVSSKGAIHANRLHTLYNELNKDVSFMKEITEKSVLSASDKSVIGARLGNFDADLQQLREYSIRLKDFQERYANSTKVIQDWVKKIRPNLSLKKLDMENTSKSFYVVQLGIMGVVFLIGISAYFLSTFFRKKQNELAEEKILDVIKKGIISQKFDEEYFVDSNNQIEFEKMRDYALKRMSFGSIYQDGMPFPSILLDSNLRMVWGNTLFYEKFNLTDWQRGDDAITWDFVQKYTNIDSGEDPVFTALKHQVAGIYQIRLNQGDSTHTEPYEMYVSPVQYQSESRVLLVFYPLCSLEQTIDSQAKSIVQPVMNTIEKMIHGNFQEADEHELEKQFRLADVSPVYERLKKLYAKERDIERGLLAQIDECEGQICDLYKLLNDVLAMSREQALNVKSSGATFKEFKRSIMGHVEKRANSESVFKKLESRTFNNLSLFNNYVRTAQITFGNYRQLIEILSNAKATRQSLREFRTLLDDGLSRLNLTLEQSIVWSKRLDDGQNFAQCLGKIKIDSKNLEQSMRDMFGVLTQFDVFHSKLEILAERPLEEGLEFVPNFKELKDTYSEIVKEHTEISSEVDSIDLAAVDSLRDIYQVISKIKVGISSITTMIEKDVMGLENKASQHHEEHTNYNDSGEQSV